MPRAVHYPPTDRHCRWCSRWIAGGREALDAHEVYCSIRTDLDEEERAELEAQRVAEIERVQRIFSAKAQSLAALRRVRAMRERARWARPEAARGGFPYFRKDS